MKIAGIKRIIFGIFARVSLCRVEAYPSERYMQIFSNTTIAPAAEEEGGILSIIYYS